jgi:ribonuclease VapC
VIVDSSALVAILREEPERIPFLRLIADAEDPKLSAASYLETAIVIDANKDPAVSRRLDDVLKDLQLIIEPVTEKQARIAREAYRDFGRGSGHPARLNYGDCFAYALAKDKGEALLFKGTDFDKTDVELAG